ncbi:hypothetical protein, partial [Candidatus Igneacidithiobacillus taiwanensis]|uniref:hypothetical protein n=1 Tax=Candidatus Igneacidithiobacillus taiwanensis TaxID=1945924 RepID=UPI002896D079
YPVKPPDPVPDMLNLHGTPPSPKKCQRFVNLCKRGNLDQTVAVISERVASATPVWSGKTETLFYHPDF